MVETYKTLSILIVHYTYQHISCIVAIIDCTHEVQLQAIACFFKIKLSFIIVFNGNWKKW